MPAKTEDREARRITARKSSERAATARSLPTVLSLRVPPLEDAAIPASADNSRDGYIGFRAYAEPSAHGTLEFSRLAWLGVGCVRAHSHRAVHDPRRENSPTTAATHLVLQVGGTSVLEQNGRLLSLERGHWTALRSDRIYTITTEGRTERIVIVVPNERLTLDLGVLQSAARKLLGDQWRESAAPYSLTTCLVDQLCEIQRTVHATALAARAHLGGLIHACGGPYKPRHRTGFYARDDDARQRIMRHGLFFKPI